MTAPCHLATGILPAPRRAAEPKAFARTRSPGNPVPRRRRLALRPCLLGDLLDHLGPDPEQSIHTIVSQARRLLNGRGSVYQRCDPAGNLLATAAASNLPPGFAPEPAWVTPPRVDSGPTCAWPAPGAENQELDPISPFPGPARGEGAKAVLSVPVFHGRRPVGALSIFDDRERRITPEETYLLSSLARLLATEEGRLQREAERQGRLRAAKERAERKTAALARKYHELFERAAARQRAIATLKQGARGVESQNRRLEKLNQALERQCLAHSAELSRLEQRSLGGLRAGVTPLIEQLKGSELTRAQRGWVHSLEEKLIEASTPFALNLIPQCQNLTPTEIKIALMIRQDHSNKQIGQLLRISPRTVEVHRNNIRRKLGITNRRVNLKTHLLCLA
jgi:DNA-binding CsgD family transcriptional regulator/GAF domain-containing protein